MVTFSANTRIKSQEVNQNFTESIDYTRSGHTHDGTDGAALWSGYNTTKFLYVPITQAQSTTTSRATVGGIADNDAGFIVATIGGNVGSVDRMVAAYNSGFLRSSGTVFFSTSGKYGNAGGAADGYVTLAFVNSGGSIVIQSVTGSFGAGNFVGGLQIFAAKNSTGLTLLP